MAHVHDSSGWNQSCQRGLRCFWKCVAFLLWKKEKTEGKDWMRETLADHADFMDEKSMIEQMLVERGHIPCFVYPELNRLGIVEALH